MRGDTDTDTDTDTETVPGIRMRMRVRVRVRVPVRVRVRVREEVRGLPYGLPVRFAAGKMARVDGFRFWVSKCRGTTVLSPRGENA